ncbi:amidohydrolase family protein [Actinomadura sp. LD22]|uniref:Amidohydrolase family protein n=1 Tax=Actinomadura physcomitrii TaxID=2650748 RepID=A0A6I4M671_9ACTN|nr:amidohydrolase family protein [Actinomadura physcomitrii]MVZ99783.1 amidohydrolase family protein [Actinomadura physcomitrii]
MTPQSPPRIDASVHVFFKDGADLRRHLREPFRSRGFPDPDVAWYSRPGPKYAEGTDGPDGSHPGSDPALVGRQVLDERGFDYAVLHPMSVAGILPDWHLGTALYAATNQMLAERWLESGPYADRFRGTVRVNPNDVEGAVREIERWRDHPRMVQIGLPVQTQAPYGRPYFKPLWRAACDAGMPVAFHLEMGVGITHPPTPSGPTRTYSHHAAYQPMTYIWHLLNMIAEGVFQEFPDLRVIWADGAGDMVTPFTWRMDTFGRPHLEQTPWAPRMPSDYLRDHIYFVHGLLDGPGEAEYASEWLRMTGKEDMVMFGSSYPDWQTASPQDLPSGWSARQRAKVLGGTAAGLFGIDRLVPA